MYEGLGTVPAVLLRSDRVPEVDGLARDRRHRSLALRGRPLGRRQWPLEAGLRPVSVVHGEVVATGERDAGAFGWEVVGVGAWLPMADGPHRPTAIHWDGDNWKERDLPIERGDVGSVSASSPSNVWALVSEESATSVLRWDGRAWAILKTLPTLSGNLAAIADDVWLFGDHKAWHYDGATWSEQNLPFEAYRVSARSASDIWALTADSRAGGDEAGSVQHFNGKEWTRVDLSQTLPKTPPPPMIPRQTPASSSPPSAPTPPASGSPARSVRHRSCSPTPAPAGTAKPPPRRQAA